MAYKLGGKKPQMNNASSMKTNAAMYASKTSMYGKPMMNGDDSGKFKMSGGGDGKFTKDMLEPNNGYTKKQLEQMVTDSAMGMNLLAKRAISPSDEDQKKIDSGEYDANEYYSSPINPDGTRKNVTYRINNESGGSLMSGMGGIMSDAKNITDHFVMKDKTINRARQFGKLAGKTQADLLFNPSDNYLQDKAKKMTVKKATTAAIKKSSFFPSKKSKLASQTKPDTYGEDFSVNNALKQAQGEAMLRDLEGHTRTAASSEIRKQAKKKGVDIDKRVMAQKSGTKRIEEYQKWQPKMYKSKKVHSKKKK